jgi:hypothetical protein
MAHTTVRPSTAMTANQSTYLRDLLAKIASPAVQDALKADLNTLRVNGLLTKAEASRQIDRVKAIISAQTIAAAAPAIVAAPVAPAPVEAPARRPFPVVEPGRYAVEHDGVLRFYNVTRGRTGRTFVRRYMSDTLVDIRMGEVMAVLFKIESDPVEAAMTFAAEQTRCFRCGRMLTDPESIALGIGPDCAGKH